LSIEQIEDEVLHDDTDDWELEPNELPALPPPLLC
jgi:hypothetical protein